MSIVHRLPVVSLRVFWDEEMAELKSKSIETHQLWVTCGRPRQGSIYLSRCRADAHYRRAMRCKRGVAEAHISNDLHEQLLSKDHSSFWRTWKNKVSSKRSAAEVVDVDQTYGSFSTIDLSTYTDALVLSVFCCCPMGECIFCRVPFAMWCEARRCAVASIICCVCK